MGAAPARRLNGSDSAVGIGAWARGRSSSKPLNTWIRRGAALEPLGRQILDNFKLATDENPGDDPSRGVAIRQATPAPAWAADLVRAPAAEPAVATACRLAGLPPRPPDGPRPRRSVHTRYRSDVSTPFTPKSK